MGRKKRKEIKVINLGKEKNEEIVSIKEDEKDTCELSQETRVYCLTMTDRYSHTSKKTGKTYIWNRGKGRPISLMVDKVDVEDLLRVKGNFSGKTYKNRAFVTEEELNSNY